MKSGIVSMMGFGKEFGGLNLGMWVILAVVTTSFGICVLITSAICGLALGTGSSLDFRFCMLKLDRIGL